MTHKEERVHCPRAISSPLRYARGQLNTAPMRASFVSRYKDQSMNKSTNKSSRFYDRTLLLQGSKRNEVLTLSEVEQYGLDSFADADYVSIYGMPPREWYSRGIRLLGRTAVECTRDALADRIALDVASVATRMATTNQRVAIDPFAGSCNTLFWILRHLPNAHGVAFDSDPQVFELTQRNFAALGQNI